MRKEESGTAPKEAAAAALREKIEKEYPALYANGVLVVDTQITRLAIDDVSYRANSPIQDAIETLALACRGWIEVYDAKMLTDVLSEKLDSLFRAIDKGRTVVIFPGNGAQVVRDLLPINILTDLSSVDVKTERRINTRTGAVEGVEIGGKTQVRELIAATRATTIIVLDDVIATGTTLTALREAFPVRNIEWFGGSLLMLVQSRKKATSRSGVEGYNAIITPIAYQGTTGIPALNSLSTLIGDSEKSKTVRSKYLLNYVEDRDTFIETSERIRRTL